MKRGILILFVLASIVGNAQYVNSIGVRGGLRGYGITYKQYFAPKLFLNVDGVGQSTQEIKGGEIIATLNIRNKIHNESMQTKAVTWSYGAGLHGGYYFDPDNTENEAAMIFGLDTRLAAEYVHKSKIGIGFDVTGYYNIMPFDKPDVFVYTNVFGAGVFLRYIIQ